MLHHCLMRIHTTNNLWFSWHPKIFAILFYAVATVESRPLKFVPACRIIRVMTILRFLTNKSAELAVSQFIVAKKLYKNRGY